MGRSASVHSAQRVTTLIAEMIERTAQSERWGMDCSDSVEEREAQNALQVWQKKRMERFPNDRRQSRLIPVSAFQDDITVFALGHRAAGEVETGIRQLLSDRYKIQLSDKEEATKTLQYHIQLYRRYVRDR